jgi:hypothetical protein
MNNNNNHNNTNSNIDNKKKEKKKYVVAKFTNKSFRNNPTQFEPEVVNKGYPSCTRPDSAWFTEQGGTEVLACSAEG